MRSPALLAAILLLTACGKDKPAPSGPAPSASASAEAADVAKYGAAIGTAFPVATVVEAVNPRHMPAYTGPKGTLKGTIRIDGDPPPDSGLKFSPRCRDAEAAYAKVFRVGLDNALADALVAVTNYGERGYVPETEEAVKIPIHRCAPPKRTYAITYGQRMEVSNIDQIESYMPYLDGVPSRTIMVAIPQGAPVKLYPSGPGPKLFMLRDQLESGLVAQVFVVNYATHDVTGLDGQYEIKNIPVGKVRVDVLLPVIEKTDAREVDIHEGDNTLDITLHFDAQRDMPKPAAPAPSAKPAASAGKPRPVFK